MAKTTIIHTRKSANKTQLIFKKIFTVAALNLFTTNNINTQTTTNNIRPSHQICLTKQPYIKNKINITTITTPTAKPITTAPITATTTTPITKITASDFNTKATYITSYNTYHATSINLTLLTK